MEDNFIGFSSKSTNFLKNLTMNNNRDWFNENKYDYNTFILEPMNKLVLDLSNFMLEIDDDLETLPAKSISRIYRDVRFSKNKTPYKNTMWITFKRSGKNWHGFPGFFFEITQTGFLLGMGFYSMTKNTRNNFRNYLLKNQESFIKIKSNFLDNKDNIFNIEGESYKRIPKDIEDILDEKLVSWYKRKKFYIITPIIENNDILFSSEKLIKYIEYNFSQISEFYKFLWDIYEE